MPLTPLDIFEKMRGIYTPVMDIRRRILVAVVKMIQERRPAGDLEHIPYEIITRNTPTYRDCIFKERAVVRERVRLALGQDLREFGAHEPVIDHPEPSLTDHRVVEKPYVAVIKIACERCPRKSYMVSDQCMGCVARPCVNVCPKNAVSVVDGRSCIDQERCIHCGRCAQVCPYNAILYRERPCESACGVNAIEADPEGFAEINNQKCVSCGLCVVSCPFGAIGEKSELVQVLHAIQSGVPVWAELAPSFVGQFGPLASPQKILAAVRAVGFTGTAEVAYGADIAILEEAEKLVEVCRTRLADPAAARTFVGTSCCPAWVRAARQTFPDLADCIQDSSTPMVETAKRIKASHPEAKVVFIGPCVSKKAEVSEIRGAGIVDFVLTYEELAAMFQAAGLDPAEIPDEAVPPEATTAGRAYPVAGNVATAIASAARRHGGADLEISHRTADSLADCMALLKEIQQGRLNPVPHLVEGMACPKGCIGGPGTLATLNRARTAVSAFAKAAPQAEPE
nr:monomeric [FeFe] hydrogenase [uncultured Holophaga sp.]